MKIQKKKYIFFFLGGGGRVEGGGSGWGVRVIEQRSEVFVKIKKKSGGVQVGGGSVWM